MYASRELQRPEQALLRRFRDRWSDMRMLDVGVGSGRTSFTFAPLAREYVGIDYSAAMIEQARVLEGEDASTRFLVCDARAMAETLGERFDLVMFCYNGLDYVGHEDRLSILKQARKVTDDDGHFFFSSHSLKSLPFTLRRPRFDFRSPLRSADRLGRSAWRALKLRRLNRRFDVSALEARGWARLRDRAHDLGLVTYYVLPEHQLAQLAEAGFSVIAVYDLEGNTVDPWAPGRDQWLYYLCRPET